MLPIAVLICSVCRLIYRDRLLKLVFSAGKKAFCPLICSICPLISVDHALILVFSASKKAVCRHICSVCRLNSVDRALIFIIAAVLMSRRNPANLQPYPFSLADPEKEVEAIFREKLNSLESE
jgi:hypothetical protein